MHEAADRRAGHHPGCFAPPQRLSTPDHQPPLTIRLTISTHSGSWPRAPPIPFKRTQKLRSQPCGLQSTQNRTRTSSKRKCEPRGMRCCTEAGVPALRSSVNSVIILEQAHKSGCKQGLVHRVSELPGRTEADVPALRSPANTKIHLTQADQQALVHRVSGLPGQTEPDVPALWSSVNTGKNAIKTHRSRSKAGVVAQGVRAALRRKTGHTTQRHRSKAVQKWVLVHRVSGLPGQTRQRAGASARAWRSRPPRRGAMLPSCARSCLARMTPVCAPGHP